MDVNKIRDIAISFQQSRILLTAFELEIFTFIGEKSLASEEIATLIKCDLRATNRLLNALVSLEFLNKTGNLFQNKEVSLKYLVKGRPGFVANLYHTNNQFMSWALLTDAVKKGTTTGTIGVTEGDREWTESFIGAMHFRAKKQAGEIISKIDLSGINKILDVGGGSGAFCMEFINKKNDIEAVVFDLPNVIPVSEKYIKSEGFENKISTIPGNYHTDEWGENYDLIFLSAVVHINSYDENARLIKKCYDSLNKNGQIIIQDFIMNESRTEPSAGSIFALNMLVATTSGDTHTENEMTEWLKNAGCRKIRRVDVSETSGLMIGIK